MPSSRPHRARAGRGARAAADRGCGAVTEVCVGRSDADCDQAERRTGHDAPRGVAALCSATCARATSAADAPSSTHAASSALATAAIACPHSGSARTTTNRSTTRPARRTAAPTHRRGGGVRLGHGHDYPQRPGLPGHPRQEAPGFERLDHAVDRRRRRQEVPRDVLERRRHAAPGREGVDEGEVLGLALGRGHEPDRCRGAAGGQGACDRIYVSSSSKNGTSGSEFTQYAGSRGSPATGTAVWKPASGRRCRAPCCGSRAPGRRR